MMNDSDEQLLCPAALLFGGVSVALEDHLSISLSFITVIVNTDTLTHIWYFPRVSG